MARYIDADKLLQRLITINSTVEQGIKYYNSVYNLVNEQPAVDVIELNKVEPYVDITERWIEIEDGAYPDGFPKTKYKHGSCEPVGSAYPFCPYCGKKITHIKTIYKEFDFIWKDKFTVE